MTDKAVGFEAWFAMCMACSRDGSKPVLRRVGRVVKDWTPSRIKDVWYCKNRVRIRATEVEQAWRGLNR
jgi:hypothetical protein